MTMGNAIRYLKMNISKLPPSLPEDKAKDALQSCISAYIRERIEFADEVTYIYDCHQSRL
jgi:translation initiation factor eIF-2B subunit delta